MTNRAAARLVVWGVCIVAVSLIGAPQHAQNAEQQGQQAIILPLELIAGQPATFAVLTANGRVAPGVRVVLSNGEVVTTDESGRAHFLAPSDLGVMFARIPGTEVRETADVLPRPTSDSGLQVNEVPKMVSLENHFTISGNGFQGDADRNRITMNGNAAFVLASSPVQLTVMPSANLPPGPASLTLTEGLAESVTTLTLVGITSKNSSAPQIHRGKKSEIVVLVRGTEEPLDLKIRNSSPQTVQLQQGNEVYVRTTGGADNSAVLQLKGENAGPFSFAVSLEGNLAKANVSVARDFLVAAQETAGPDLTTRIKKIVKELHGKNIDLAKMRNDLRKIPTSGSADFQALTRASVRALNGE